MKLLRLGACVGLMLVAVERAHAADEVSEMLFLLIPWSVGILSGTDALLARALFWFYDGLPPTTPTRAILPMVPA
jgi:hypothetical protein